MKTTPTTLARRAVAVLGTAVALVSWASLAPAFQLKEPASLADAVSRGQLPPVTERMPKTPLVTKQYVEKGPGKSGGDLNTLVATGGDVRLMTVYGYARLVGYDPAFKVVPDILETLTIEEGRIFTLKLRRGHRWSDGQPFTSEDFRYWWEDVANNRLLSSTGVPSEMLVDGKPPKFEIVDETTVRYTWPAPNGYFVEALARTAPLFIYRPAHYLKKFHEKYAAPDDLAKAVAASRQPTWQAMHSRYDVMYRNDNPDLPTLNPWINTTRGSSQRYVFVRNPYFHRADSVGMQLPYIDRFILNVASATLIPSKAGLGESDLQARYVRFADYTFLRQGMKKFGLDVRLWDTGNGGPVVFYPNLTTKDPVWRALFHDARFRRALSIAIDREEINEAVFQGMAVPSNNTVRPSSPLFREEYRTGNATYDPKKAKQLLDEIGLKPDGNGGRLLPDGRPLFLEIESADDSKEEDDVLRLVFEHWKKVGIRAEQKPTPRDILRQHTFSGDAQMVIWAGMENASADADTPPVELAPTSQGGLQWSAWGYHYQTRGKNGQACNLAPACELVALLNRWEKTADATTKEQIWHQMLKIHIDQQFTIGIVSNVPQPVVVREVLRNVPKKAVYAWHPAAFFGAYRPDLFWFEGK